MALLSVQGLSIHIEDEDGSILSDVTFDVEPGSCVGLVGRSGRGKSSLLEAIVGIAKIKEGRALVCSSPSRKGSCSKKLAFLPQSAADLIFPWATVEKNVEAVLSVRKTGQPSRTESLSNLLESVCLASRQKSYPATLSGGELKRLALAMVLATGADLLLLDEPLTGLDLDLRIELWKEIRQYIGSERGALLVSHSLEDVAVLCDKALFLKDRPTAPQAPSSSHFHTWESSDRVEPGCTREFSSDAYENVYAELMDCYMAYVLNRGGAARES